MEISVGGPVAVRHEMQSIIQEDLLRAELIALPVTLVLLVMVFGSAVAALLPLGVGIVAILGTNAVLRGITEFTDVSVFAQNLTTALGLGLAIDYALFIVRRFREELSAGADPRAAIGTTLRTAGRTVLFSALTVAVSLAAMMVFPQYFLRSFAYAGIAVVLLAAAAALILLPAALMLLGPRVNALDLRRLPRRRRATAGRRTGRLPGRARGLGQGMGPPLGARDAKGSGLRGRHHGRTRAPGAPVPRGEVRHGGRPPAALPRPSRASSRNTYGKASPAVPAADSKSLRRARQAPAGMPTSRSGSRRSPGCGR